MEKGIEGVTAGKSVTAMSILKLIEDYEAIIADLRDELSIAHGVVDAVRPGHGLLPREQLVGLVGQQGGRHQRPEGFERDCEKLSLAAAHGWRVVKVTPGQVRDGRWLVGMGMASAIRGRTSAQTLNAVSSNTFSGIGTITAISSTSSGAFIHDHTDVADRGLPPAA